MREYKCQTCEADCSTKTKRGRMPKYCDKCNPKSPQSRARELARHHSKKAGAVRQATAADMQHAGRLAVGLSIHDDLADAAQWAGIDSSTMPIDIFEGLARKHYSGVIDCDVPDLGRRIVAMMNMLLVTTMQVIDEISPRDRVNAVRQMASARDLIVGNNERAQFANINLSVIGADGKPVDVLSDDESPGAVH